MFGWIWHHQTMPGRETAIHIHSFEELIPSHNRVDLMRPTVRAETELLCNTFEL